MAFQTAEADPSRGEEAPFLLLKRVEGLRRAIIALVGARLPGIRDELERRLAGQTEARLEQLALELGDVHDEDAVRAVLDRS